MDDWRHRSTRATYVLLVASFLLISPSVVGFGSTGSLAGGLAILAAGLWTVRDQLRALPSLVGYDLGWYARDSWVAAAIAAPVVLVNLGSPPAELQALGGVIGLAGMANYFLRPLYLLVAGFLWNMVRGA